MGTRPPLLRLLVWMAIAGIACAVPRVSYRRVGTVQPPPFAAGCPLDILSAPGERPAVPIGEVRCDPGEGATQDACVQDMKDVACQLGGTALGVGPNEGRVLTATVLRYEDTIPGYSAQPPQPTCDPPCAQGREVCTDQGCAPDPNAPPAEPALSPEEEAEMHSVLARLERAVTRCLRGVEGPLKVHLEVEPSGAVVSVRIEGDLASTDAGACAEEKLFGATFTPFEGENRTITHEFTP